MTGGGEEAIRPLGSPLVTGSEIALMCGGVALGGLAGLLVPAWVARLPAPVAEEGEEEISYAELSRWPALPAVAAVTTAACWGLVTWRLGVDVALPAVLYLLLAGTLLAYVDLRVRLLPNAVVLPSYAVVAVLLGAAALVSGAWTQLAWALVGGAALWAFLAFLGLLAPSGMGFGDVKLAGVLGIGLGWFGLPYVLLGTFVAFVLGGLVSLVLVLAGRAHRKSAIPFGPFLLLGFLITVIYGDQVVGWYLAR